MGDRNGDIDRYEQLRRRILDGEPSGWQLGWGVLAGRGVAAWLRVCHTIVLPPSAQPPAPSWSPLVDAGDVVGVLASMALACADAGR